MITLSTLRTAARVFAVYYTKLLSVQPTVYTDEYSFQDFLHEEQKPYRVGIKLPVGYTENVWPSFDQAVELAKKREESWRAKKE